MDTQVSLKTVTGIIGLIVSILIIVNYWGTIFASPEDIEITNENIKKVQIQTNEKFDNVNKKQEEIKEEVKEIDKSVEELQKEVSEENKQIQIKQSEYGQKIINIENNVEEIRRGQREILEAVKK
jgi:peptidoglycan hydrolase CwlO-like protein